MKNKKNTIAVISILVAVFAVMGLALFFLARSKEAAKVSGKEYTVTFYNDGEVYETVKVQEGARVKLPEAPKSNDATIDFAGWTQIDGDVEELVDFSEVGIVSDCSVYALWMDVFEVVLNADNGDPFETLKLFSGELIEEPEEPKKEGYRFVEWKNMKTETAHNFDKPVYSSFTLKAMYGDGAPNRVSETLWDFSKGVGSWKADQGAWGHSENGVTMASLTEERVNEEGYAGWYYGGLEGHANGYALKIFGNDGISVSAQKAKVVVMYIKSTDAPIDSYRISILTNLGGSIFNYGADAAAWAIKSDSLNKELCQIDEMKDGWTRVQFKISELGVWGEETMLNGLSIATVQSPTDPRPDTIYLKSIELLDQEDFIDPKGVQKVTQTSWDMTKTSDSSMWFGAQNQGITTSTVTTEVGKEGTAYTYKHTNAWKGILLQNAAIPINKTSNVLSVTYKTKNIEPAAYRVYVVTDKGGSPSSNTLDDVKSYYAIIDPRSIKKDSGWTYKNNSDGTTTITYDLTRLAYWKNGTKVKALTFAIIDGGTTGTVTYKSISLNGKQNPNDVWKPSGPVVTQTSWDMSNKTHSAMWYSAQDKTVTNTVKTEVGTKGTTYTYSATNPWKGVILENAAIDMSKLSGKFSITFSTSLNMKTYRIYLLTDAGGSLTDNAQSDKASYYNETSTSNLGRGWSSEKNSDGTTTVTFDLSRLEYWKKGTKIEGISFVPIDAGAKGSITYKSMSFEAGTAATVKKVTQISWNMADKTDSEMWYSAQDKNVTNTVTTEVGTAGTKYTYSATNPWKGIILEDGDIDISKLNGKFSVTYSTDLTINSYRMYILTDAGGSLTDNAKADKASYYIETAAKSASKGWTITNNNDGTTTVTCDLNRLEYWQTGKKLQGITFVAVDASGKGSITYKSMKFEEGTASTEKVTQTAWDMADKTDSEMWYGAQNQGITNSVSTTVSPTGTTYTYDGTNAWKGIMLENAEIAIADANKMLSVTYSTDMAVSNYRVYVLTNKGGSLTLNNLTDKDSYYVNMKVADIADGTGWTRTENADGTITVTYDLSNLDYWKTGTTLVGLTFVTVTNSEKGSVTYKAIQLTEEVEQETPEPVAPVTQTTWDMTDETDSAMWYGVQNKTATNVVTTNVSEEGTRYSYNHINAWKGLILKDQNIQIKENNSLLSITYNTDLTITSYRVYVLTDKGGSLTENNLTDKASYYAEITVSNITDGSGWTRTENADGTITVTYDLSKLAYWKNGITLNGLTFVTVTGSATGYVNYKSIELTQQTSWDMSKQTDSAMWYGVQDKTATNVVTTNVSEEGTRYSYNHTNAWKGLILKDQSIQIKENNSLLSITYNTDLTITSYRVYVLTDKGGSLTDNALTDKASYYAEIKVSNITDGSGWTRTENADGTITVTYDLNKLAYWKNGETLNGLTFVTVTGAAQGYVNYKSIELTQQSTTSPLVSNELLRFRVLDVACAEINPLSKKENN